MLRRLIAIPFLITGIVLAGLAYSRYSVQFAFRSFAALCETFAAFAVKSRQDRKVREVKTQSYAKDMLFQIRNAPVP